MCQQFLSGEFSQGYWAYCTIEWRSTCVCVFCLINCHVRLRFENNRHYTLRESGMSIMLFDCNSIWLACSVFIDPAETKSVKFKNRSQNVQGMSMPWTAFIFLLMLCTGLFLYTKKHLGVQGLYKRIGERTATTKAEVREKIDFIIVFDATD